MFMDKQEFEMKIVDLVKEYFKISNDLLMQDIVLSIGIGELPKIMIVGVKPR